MGAATVMDVVSPEASFTGDRNVRLSDYWPEAPGVWSSQSSFHCLNDRERVPKVLADTMEVLRHNVILCMYCFFSLSTARPIFTHVLNLSYFSCIVHVFPFSFNYFYLFACPWLISSFSFPLLNDCNRNFRLGVACTALVTDEQMFLCKY